MRILITGGTGFLGKHLVRHYIAQGCEVVSFSRSEARHEEQKREVNSPALKSYIGDVRDQDTVQRAMAGADAVIHAAAQKHVPWSEEFPEECYKTNVQGTINVWRACQEEKIDPSKALLVSTDKACKPINTYGASKLMAECVWGGLKARFGNIWGSTGSVIYWLMKQRGTGTMKITEPLMRRYHIKVDACVKFISDRITPGPEIDWKWTPGLYIPSFKWYVLRDLAQAVDPAAKLEYTGIRRGEKMWEDLLEAGDAYDERDRLTVEELREEVRVLCGSMETAAMPR